MVPRIALRRVPPALRSSALRPVLTSGQHQTAYRRSSSMPSVADTSFWKSLVPKPLRRENARGSKADKDAAPREWNPATFYIVIFLLIGSMAVNSLAMKQEFERTVRRADVRIAQLREVIERIQRGEKVDVEKELGTGDKSRELQWEEVLREIERADITRTQRKQDKPKSNTPQTPSPDATNSQQAKPTRAAQFF